jgi:hypothetical protein
MVRAQPREAQPSNAVAASGAGPISTSLCVASAQPVGGRHTLGAVSLSNGHRSPIQSLDRIAELAQTLAPPLKDAADAGARKSGGLEFVGRGHGFTDSDPTGTAALDPTRRQMRDAVRRAVRLILRAEDEPVEAGAVIANG